MLILSSPLIHWRLPIAEIQNAQLLMVAGFVMLGWVLARRQMKMRKRVNRDARAANKQLKAIQQRVEPAVPLCDAPPETQRWQVALFDLQRELKAELDTRIAVVHTLMRQLDDRIERLSALEGKSPGSMHALGGSIETQRRKVQDLARSGYTAREISQRISLPVGDVELILNTLSLD